MKPSDTVSPLVSNPDLLRRGEPFVQALRTVRLTGVLASTVANVILWEDLHEVVLCGHSYGGMVIAGVADAMPERCAALVYLDAVVPEAGKSYWT